MAVLLYLSNKMVQAVEAKQKGRAAAVQNVWQEEVPEGCIINGIITDEETFLAWITDFFDKNRLPRKDITLVVNSSQFNHKVLELPKLKEEEIKKLLPREFAENRTEQTLFTYYTLEESTSKMQKLLVTAVEKPFLLSYINFFRQAEIEITAVDSEINALVRLFANAPELQKKTCLIQVLDGQEVISMLFLQGVYYYSQKNRLFEQDSPEALAEELSAIRGRLFQFATSQQIKEPITDIYLCGNGQKLLQVEMETDRIFSGEKVIVKEKEVRKKNVEFVYPAGYLLGNRQGLSFIKQIKQEQKKNKKQREIGKFLLPAAAVFLIGLLITVFMGHTYLSRSKELKKMENAMQDEATLAANADYELAQANLDNMKNKIAAAEEIWNHLMSYPTMDSSIEQVLLSCGGNDISLEVKSFQRDSGVLTMDAYTEDVRNINVFIGRLQEQECFENVEYSGYTYISGSDRYQIHVVVSLAESAGR
jgi:hypothetical protein